VANLVYAEDRLRDDSAGYKYITSSTTFSGREGAVIGYASNAPMITSGTTIISSAAMVYGHIVGAVVVLSARPTEQQYDPEFVRKIREADAKPPVAKFTNVVDMMEWLDRD
jgi:hypothetical protein